MKKWVKIILCVLLALLLLAGGYVAYVFIDYHRIGDQMLTPVQSTDAARSVDTNTAYTVVSWNIGFGAYEEDYGFFISVSWRIKCRLPCAFWSAYVCRANTEKR